MKGAFADEPDGLVAATSRPVPLSRSAVSSKDGCCDA